MTQAPEEPKGIQDTPPTPQNAVQHEQETNKQSVSVVTELIKQIITLSTATIVLSGTLLGVVVKQTTSGTLLRQEIAGRGFLVIAWMALGVSIVAGISAMMLLASSLSAGSGFERFDIYERSETIPVSVEVIAFLIGLIFFCVFVASNF